MFSTGLRQDGLNLIRMLLPMDTGNLRFNGTIMTGSNNEVTYQIGGIMADYFVYLLYGKHADTIESIPYEVYDLFEARLNNKHFEWDLDKIGLGLDQLEVTNKIEQRNKEFFSSLSRNDVNIGDVLGR